MLRRERGENSEGKKNSFDTCQKEVGPFRRLRMDGEKICLADQRLFFGRTESCLVTPLACRTFREIGEQRNGRFTGLARDRKEREARKTSQSEGEERNKGKESYLLTCWQTYGTISDERLFDCAHLLLTYQVAILHRLILPSMT
eukprot:762514-Hanusia_phi.AAC.1